MKVPASAQALARDYPERALVVQVLAQECRRANGPRLQGREQEAAYSRSSGPEPRGREPVCNHVNDLRVREPEPV